MHAFYAWTAPWLLAISEGLMVLAALFLSCRADHTNSSGFDRLENFFRRLAHRRRASLFVVGASALALRAILIPVLHIPLPKWNDEFSYLLAAKTFAMGRLTNPTPPMWQHFESFQIVMKPTYMSMYTPGQGLVLAFGKLLGHPWIGVWLLTSILCAALCWMLQAWVPPTWALAGGVFAVFRLAVFSYWMNSYWVPALAATGGALVLGAIPRIAKRAQLRHGVLLALGLVILANSRPFEGLVFSIAVFAATLVYLRGRRTPPPQVLFRRIILPALLILIISAAGTGYYYWRVTGSPVRMTYAVDRETYAVVPYFVFFGMRPVPHYNHVVMRDYYSGWEVQQFQEARTLSGFMRRTTHKAVEMWRFYIGPLLTIPFLFAMWHWRDRRMRLALIALAIFSIGMLVETWTFPHYVAPATGLAYILLIQGMRHLRLWRWQGRPAGVFFARSLPLIFIGMLLLRISGIVAQAHLEPRWPRGNLDLPVVTAQLEKIPGRHLMIVKYGPDHNVDRDWIYNEPDIAHARIIWVRDMGEAENRKLINYFNECHVWSMQGDDVPPKIIPYPVSDTH